MIRCKDIAEMVGVSRQAVTDVLNNSRPNCVSKEKRAKILEIAAKYNYRPNYAAKALKTGRSNVIGIVMPPWDNPYIAELCMALQRALLKENYTPFFTIDNNYNPVAGNLEQLLSLQAAGIITVASSLLPDDIDIPVVSYFYDDPRFDSVCPDVEFNSRITVEYLNGCGHKKIGYLGSLRDQLIKHLTADAGRNGMLFWERWQIDSNEADDISLFEQLLERNKGQDLPGALIVHSDVLALKLMRRIHELGYRIPEDFSIIGHDNISFCANSVPALTSIGGSSPDEIAADMIDLLLKRIKDPGRPREKRLLKTELFKRESVMILKDTSR